MKIAVFGAGGVGGFFGARLWRSEQDVIFIARGPHLEAMRENGLKLETPDGHILVNPIEATDRPDEVGPVDAVLVAVKAWQVEEAAKAMRPLMGEGTIVIPFQNGVEAPEQLASALGREHVVGGLCILISYIKRPGVIQHVGGAPYVALGELDNKKTERISSLNRVIEGTGVDCEVPDDIHAAMWNKFLLITSFGGVGSITRAPIGAVRSLPETRGLLEEAMHEVVAVATAQGVILPNDAALAAMKRIDEFDPSSTASMQRDIAEERPSELEYQNGAVVRLGRSVGVATPLHDFIYRSLLPHELRARQQLDF